MGVATGNLLYVWGYCPEASWRAARTVRPDFLEGGLRVSDEKQFQPGIARRVGGSRSWICTFDEASGWVRIASDHGNGESAYLIAESAGIELRSGFIHAVWLMPVFE